MTRLAMSDLGNEYARIFGATAETGTGRSRLCKTCGAWHALDKPWPHNCRPEAPPRSHLASPQIAPKFEEFVTGKTDTAEIIGDRRAKRTFMDRHDLAEYDEGVSPPPPPSERQWEREFVQDFKRAQEEDPLNRPPVEVIGQTDTNDAGDIDVAGMEIAK